MIILDLDPLIRIGSVFSNRLDPDSAERLDTDPDPENTDPKHCTPMFAYSMTLPRGAE
jgi:hypothetical protein